MRTIHVVVTSLVGVWLTSGGLAQANTEPPAGYDARSVGMGSTGVAYVHNGASLYYNPAALQGVNQGAITLDISPLAPQLTAPLGVNGASLKSERSVFPMFLVGGAYRVSPKLTLGLAVFPTMGFGAKYTSAPALGGALLKSQVAAIEAAPGASFAITDDIAIGATYRITYMSLGLEQPVPPPAPAGTSSKVDLSGWSFLGFQLGVFARATKTTRLGLTYRNKVSVNMTGNNEMGGQALHAEAEFAAAHAFKLGVAQSLMEDKLLLALDLKMSLYKDSNKDLVLKTDIPGAGTQPFTLPLNWKNTFGVYAGAEYRFAPQGPAVRLGYSLSQSATPAAYAQPILPPPGLQHAIHAGAGIAISAVDVDLGGYYLFGGESAQPTNGFPPPGDYKMNAFLVALSGTYHW